MLRVCKLKQSVKYCIFLGLCPQMHYFKCFEYIIGQLDKVNCSGYTVLTYLCMDIYSTISITIKSDTEQRKWFVCNLLWQSHFHILECILFILKLVKKRNNANDASEAKTYPTDISKRWIRSCIYLLNGAPFLNWTCFSCNPDIKKENQHEAR